MAGIAGIAEKGAQKNVYEMLSKISHRGIAGRHIFETNGSTFGVIWNESESKSAADNIEKSIAGYEIGPGHYVKAGNPDSTITITRDELGVAPLYYGRDNNGKFCFSSEVKALLHLTGKINEMLPGYTFDGTLLKSFYKLKAGEPIQDDPDQIADKLYSLLDNAVASRIKSDDFGSWLSGGLDSSVISSLAARHTGKLRTFSAGIRDAPDLKFARGMAEYIKSDHHETVVSLDDMIKVLPQVIYHLESFDALLVRSSITNFLVAEMASDYVSEVFSGEGGDELFAGYEYLKSIPLKELQNELVSITLNLHNTALQRVDRCSSANRTTAHVVFTDPAIVNFAFRIPAEYKIHDNIEKWILRKAMKNHLPESVFSRPKAKFWEGAGVKELISDYAMQHITDSDFSKERLLPNGWILNTKEELFYYRIFKIHFGTDLDLSWMGRTKGSPVEN